MNRHTLNKRTALRGGQCIVMAAIVATAVTGGPAKSSEPERSLRTAHGMHPSNHNYTAVLAELRQWAPTDTCAAAVRALVRRDGKWAMISVPGPAPSAGKKPPSRAEGHAERPVRTEKEPYPFAAPKFYMEEETEFSLPQEARWALDRAGNVERGSRTWTEVYEILERYAGYDRRCAAAYAGMQRMKADKKGGAR